MHKTSHKANIASSEFVRTKRLGQANFMCHAKGMEFRLKSLRKARGWTQEHVADMVGVTKSHISEMESGKKNASHPLLVKLSELFGLTPAEMLSSGQQAHLTDDEAALLEWFRTVPESERHLVRRLLQAAAEQAPRDPAATPPTPGATGEPRE